MADEELLQLFRQKASVQMLAGFQDSFPVLQMIVLHGNPEYYAGKKQSILNSAFPMRFDTMMSFTGAA